MAAPDITLKEGTILLTQETSQLDIYQVNNAFINGRVEQVNDLDDVYSVNDIVLFDANEAVMFKYSDTTYYVAQVDKIFYKENFIAP